MSKKNKDEIMAAMKEHNTKYGFPVRRKPKPKTKS